LATSTRELKSKSLGSSIEKLSAPHREPAGFYGDESDDEAELGSDSDEPLAKRRSLSPEDDSLPEAGRTRSGRIYQPAVTDVNLDGRREANLPPPSMAGTLRSTASKTLPRQTSEGTTPRPAQQAPDGSYAIRDIELRHLTSSKAKSSPRGLANKNKLPELSIRIDALEQNLDSYRFDYATPPPSSGFMRVSTKFFGPGDYGSWQVEDSSSS
jgi:hypothetical protein